LKKEKTSFTFDKTIRMATARHASDLDAIQSLSAQIQHNLDHPAILEKFYRNDKSSFEKAFDVLDENTKQHPVAQVWQERLHYYDDTKSTFDRRDWLMLALLIFLSGWVVKLPDLFDFEKPNFFMRNIGFICFPFMMAWLLWKQRPLTRSAMLFPLMVVLISIIYINVPSDVSNSSSFNLACIHLPIFLWTITGMCFAENENGTKTYGIGFLRFNGDWIVMGVLLGLTAMAFTGITLGLFNMIGFRIEDWYMKTVGIWGAVAIPLVGGYLVLHNRTLVSRISPLIARIFTPLVTLLLLAFLVSIPFAGKDPYSDRDFLMLFNAILIGVMALIVFSTGELTKSNASTFHIYVLTALSVLAILDNGIALTAISYRLSEFGSSPNRLAVLGGNLLILIHLIRVSRALIQTARGRWESNRMEEELVQFLPVYSIWAAVVTFLFPLFFLYK
jgi:hypothetical protein